MYFLIYNVLGWIYVTIAGLKSNIYKMLNSLGLNDLRKRQFNINNSTSDTLTTSPTMVITAPGDMLTTATATRIKASGDTLTKAPASVSTPPGTIMTATAMLATAPQPVPCLMWHYLNF